MWERLCSALKLVSSRGFGLQLSSAAANIASLTGGDGSCSEKHMEGARFGRLFYLQGWEQAKNNNGILVGNSLFLRVENYGSRWESQGREKKQRPWENQKGRTVGAGAEMCPSTKLQTIFMPTFPYTSHLFGHFVS